MMCSFSGKVKVESSTSEPVKAAGNRVDQTTPYGDGHHP